jgi:hypothetical protein
MAPGKEQEILVSLGAGAPLPPEHAKGILNDTLDKATIAPINAVRRARAKGAVMLREVYWLTGRPGCGKTQALNLLVDKLQNLDGVGKYAVTRVALDQERSATTSGGLAYSIVRHALAGQSIPEIHSVAARILKRSGSDKKISETVGFGVDVLAGLAGLPPASLFAAAGFRKVISLFKMTGPYVRSKLQEKWSGQPQILELLHAWVLYVLKPSSNNRDGYEQVLLRLSGQPDFFGLFCTLLQAADYSTLVIVLDEVTESSLRGIKTLWDPPVMGSSSNSSKLNLVLIIAAPKSVYENAKADQMLARRLCATQDGFFLLEGANITYAQSNDDFEHAVKVIKEILRTAPYLSHPDGDQGLAQLRGELAKQSPVIWQVLWNAVINQLVDLRI